MLRYGSGSVPIATGWKCTNCHRTHRSSIPRSASGNTRARPELTTGTSRPLPNWSAPCPGSSERCKTILSRSDPICFLFVLPQGTISTAIVVANIALLLNKFYATQIDRNANHQDQNLKVY